MDLEALSLKLESALGARFKDATEISVQVLPIEGSVTKHLVDIYVVAPGFLGMKPVEVSRSLISEIGHLVDFDRFLLAAGGHASTGNAPVPR